MEIISLLLGDGLNLISNKPMAMTSNRKTPAGVTARGKKIRRNVM